MSTGWRTHKSQSWSTYGRILAAGFGHVLAASWIFQEPLPVQPLIAVHMLQTKRKVQRTSRPAWQLRACSLLPFAAAGMLLFAMPGTASFLGTEQGTQSCYQIPPKPGLWLRNLSQHHKNYMRDHERSIGAGLSCKAHIKVGSNSEPFTGPLAPRVAKEERSLRFQRARRTCRKRNFRGRRQARGSRRCRLCPCPLQATAAAVQKTPGEVDS